MDSGANAGGTRDAFWEGVNEYAGAKGAIDKLANKKFKTEDLQEWLWVAAQVERLTRAGSPPLRIHRIAGMPLHTFRGFSRQVRAWAKRIRALQIKMALDPTATSILKRLQPMMKTAPDQTCAMSAEELFRKLPEILDYYSGFIRIVGAVFQIETAGAIGQMRAFREIFVYYTKCVTGNPHFSDITNLLNAAYHASELKVHVDKHTLEEGYRRSKFIKQLSPECTPSELDSLIGIMKEISAALSRRVQNPTSA